jgi:hypothetical protein
VGAAMVAGAAMVVGAAMGAAASMVAVMAGLLASEVAVASVVAVASEGAVASVVVVAAAAGSVMTSGSGSVAGAGGSVLAAHPGEHAAYAKSHDLAAGLTNDSAKLQSASRWLRVQGATSPMRGQPLQPASTWPARASGRAR